jgi:hypothetical protein
MVGTIFYSAPHPWRPVRCSSVAVVWHGGACELLRHDGTRATSARLWHTMWTIHTTRHPAYAPATLRGIRRLARALW